MRVGARLLLFLLIAPPATSIALDGQSALPSCVRFEPDTVRLTGVLDQRAFSGLPNHTSMKLGDPREAGPYLALSAPLCTYGGGESSMNEPHKNVRLVQLVLSPDAFARDAAYLYFDSDRLIRRVDSTGKSRAVTGPNAEAHAQDAMHNFRALERCATSVAGSDVCEPPAGPDAQRAQRAQRASPPGALKVPSHRGAPASRARTDTSLHAAASEGEISRNESAWRSSEPRRYSFDYRYTCFCPGSGVTYRATVQNGTMISQTVVGSARGTPSIIPPLTIDSLFATIIRAQRHKAPKLEVDFDPVRHFPKSIYILWEAFITDSDTRVEVIDFRQLK